MQILEPPSDIRTTYDEQNKVHVIEGFLISTKPNEALWRISKRTGHEKVKSFLGKDFPIIPDLIHAPLNAGGGGHYFGNDTREDILEGYAKHSHGKITKIKGPYYYNDGTDDYWYNFHIALKGSKAASALIEQGQRTWINYAVSPHIWPNEGTDDDITDWEGLGVALVIKGAYGPQAVVTKLCKGSAASCEKSLGASAIKGMLCEKEDAKIADFISSLVSKSASIPISMSENKDVALATNAPAVTNVANPVPEVTNAAKKTVVENTPQVDNAPKIVSAEQMAATEKRIAELEKANKQLLDDKRNTELNGLLVDFVGTTDEKVKTEFVDKWFKKEVDTKVLREFYQDIKNLNTEKRKRASSEGNGEEEEGEGKPENGQEVSKKAKSKSASLPREPELPTKVTTESKAASTPENKARVIGEFLMGGS